MIEDRVAVRLICQKLQPSKVRIFKFNEPVNHFTHSSSHTIGWNKLETIDSLLRKGGFRGHITDDVRNAIKLTRYTSQEIHMNYPTYVEVRDRYHATGIVTCQVQC